MNFTQMYTPGLAHCSYMMAGEKACIVVDPARDVGQYVAQARAWNQPITAIIETHLHADFVSGHLELARMTGATIYAPAVANCEFAHRAMNDGEELTIDSFKIKMIETPGHTPEGACFVVSDLTRGPEPCLVFTGDTLLIGDVGRPDLFPDKKEQLATSLYQSLRKLEKLGDNVELYPAHGAGSLCGRALSAKLWSTVGNERLYNYALSVHPLESFKHALLTGIPEAPDHFARCSEINRRGPALVSDLAAPRSLSPRQFAELAAEGHSVVDIRDQLAFAGAHIKDAYALSIKGNFATFAGWVLPPEKPLLLVLENETDLNAALTGLRRVGLDNVVGFLAGGMTAWANAGMDADSLESISVPELRRRLDAGAVHVIDTRLRSEYDAGHIEGAVLIAAPDARDEHPALKPERSLAVICNTGNRSVLAASLLRQRGFKHVVNVIGGTTAWQAAGYPLTAPAEGAVAHD